MSEWKKIMRAASALDVGKSKPAAVKPVAPRRRREIKPITQRLRELESFYIFTKAERDAIWQARQLITDLWELHWEPHDDFREEVIRLFENAGLELGEGHGSGRDVK